MRKPRHHYTLIIGLGLLLLYGCGTRDLAKQETYPARGRVLLHGEPARYVKVRLEPETPGEGLPCEAATDGNGTFELRTYSNEAPDGAVPGRYRVVLESAASSDEGPPVIVPKGAKPTAVPASLAEVTVEIKSEDNDLEISFP
jgi:hypothetical protein